jgi:hypothetical protein
MGYNLADSWEPQNYMTSNTIGLRNMLPSRNDITMSAPAKARPARRTTRSIRTVPDDADYPVERLLEKRGNMFYLQWKDGTRSWQHRRDVSEDLIDPFEAEGEGYHLGVIVLYKRPTGRAPFRSNSKTGHGRTEQSGLPIGS